jgi:NADPH-dependent curcumin reductase CurA
MFPKTYRKMILTQFGDDFRACTKIVETPWQDPGDDDVVVKNIYAGVNGIYDYNMMRNAVDYIKIDLPADLGIEVVGRIVAVGRNVKDYKEGDAVAAWKVGNGYRDYQVIAQSRLYKIREPSPEILTLIPTGVSGMIGLEQVGEMKRGEIIAVSAAAGGLGHIVVQVAKQAGNHVIGLASSDEKCATLRKLGCDRPINYNTENVADVLKAEYPNGIDIAYDSVGGITFDTFLDHLAVKGRLVISGYTAEVGKPPQMVTAQRPWTKLYFKSASIRGFINPHFQEFWPDAAARLLHSYYAGTLTVLIDPQTFVGLEAVPDAVAHLMSGRNSGKVVITLDQ